MPIACAAVVGISLVWLTYLTIIQLFSGPRRDSKSLLPVPPRKVQGNGALPVLGHTLLFLRAGGDVASHFKSEWREWTWNPWSRKLGDCFSIFIWGKWRVIVTGPERCKYLMENSELSQGWAWSPPITLLGQNCLPLLKDDDEEVEYLRQMIEEPLSHESIVLQAPQFAKIAKKCIDNLLLDRKFSNNVEASKDAQGSMLEPNKICRNKDNGEDNNDDILLVRTDSSSASSVSEEESNTNASYKIKWEDLRSYTLDLFDGPVLNLNRFVDLPSPSCGSNPVYHSNSDQKRGIHVHGTGVHHAMRFQDSNGGDKTGNQLKSKTRALMLLWMERLKYGLCDTKITFGREWMQVWRLNRYGRSLNARDHLERIIGAHVEAIDKVIPVLHEPGHLTRDPFASAMPLVKMTQDVFRQKVTVFGTPRFGSYSSRPRFRSEPELRNPQLQPSRPKLPSLKPMRGRAESEPIYVSNYNSRKSCLGKPEEPGWEENEISSSILEHILSQEGEPGRGLSRAVTTDVMLLLWMMMDAGQAWTSMSLSLLSMDANSRQVIQMEVDKLAEMYGDDCLFTSFVLSKMERLDTLIYEAIRLSPQFLGGVKVVKETVEVGGFQIPRNTNVICCQPSEAEFDLQRSIGKKPERMGDDYPSVYLHGFLALNGLEVPLLVLQTKVFLIVLLREYSPFLSQRHTFIRRVQTAINESFRRTSVSIKGREVGTLVGSDIECGADDRVEISDAERNENPSPLTARGSDLSEVIRTANEYDKHSKESLATKLFSFQAFPEPRRVINIRHRGSNGVASPELPSSPMST